VTLDAFASRYGWDAETIDRQPQSVIEEMPMLWRAQAAARRAGQLAQKGTALAYQQIAPAPKRR
jgi:hypothetical protein